MEYWEYKFEDLMPGVVFKFKKTTPLVILDLAERNIGKSGESAQFKLDCLRLVVWSRNGENWFDLMDEDGNTTLQDLPLSTLLDIFFKFRSTVLLPVFTESRTYQALSSTKATEDSADSKKHT